MRDALNTEVVKKFQDVFRNTTLTQTEQDEMIQRVESDTGLARLHNAFYRIPGGFRIVFAISVHF